MSPSAVSAVIVELGRAGVAGDDEGMIAGRREGTVDAAEHGAALVADLGDLAVHGHGRAHDVAAESLSDGLMAEADAEHRDARRRRDGRGRGRCRPRSGVHGPGDRTTASGSSARIASVVVSSLRTTSIERTRGPIRWTRFQVKES